MIRKYKYKTLLVLLWLIALGSIFLTYRIEIYSDHSMKSFLGYDLPSVYVSLFLAIFVLVTNDSIESGRILGIICSTLLLASGFLVRSDIHWRFFEPYSTQSGIGFYIFTFSLSGIFLLSAIKLFYPSFLNTKKTST